MCILYFIQLQILRATGIPIRDRISSAWQQGMFNYWLDSSFCFDEFIEGAKLSYVVIRQLTSNVKVVSDLKVLDGLIASHLLQVVVIVIYSEAKNPYIF